MEYLCKTQRLLLGDGVTRAAAILREGGTVAFPTETVYGLGANALDEPAVAKIFEAKGRPGWDPLIVHVGDGEMLARVAKIGGEFATRVQSLIAAFWPGPLTMLLLRTTSVPDAVTAGRPLVGVRMPAHPVALDLIRLAGVPLAAPSANRFGHTSPTTAAHVLEDLNGRIDAVLDGGATTIGIESTVLAVMETPMVIYRPGAVTARMIEEATECEVVTFAANASDGVAPREGLPSPGVGLKHYAPRARLELVEVRGKNEEVSDSLTAAIQRSSAAGEVVGAMLPEGWAASNARESFDLGTWGNEEQFAQRLFAGLRALDAHGVSVIVCPIPAGKGLGVALRDRLEKAARV